MSVISKDKNVIKIYYNSQSSIGKQTLGYLESSYKDILAIDTEKTKVTGTQWAELASDLNLQISELIDKEHPSFVKHYSSDSNLNDEGWIKILRNNPEVFIYPIVILGNNSYRIINPSDIEKHLDPNSKGLDEQHPN